LVVRANDDQGTVTCGGSGEKNMRKYISFVMFVEADTVEDWKVALEVKRGEERMAWRAEVISEGSGPGGLRKLL
jgi:hypothetical protein